ncbi:hypothetical protein HanXRQr2_Chr03g0135531 [Helianthus annuus]|uniref:Uncharacterized protein n=1 Tax=Helianthus annuus TaxID=4232 RepID=A0A9K3JLE1_HELAN|nr:hypothetical protein HanXRQr2_Chr03g0135531 [Helianthus annuus]KAJ0945797.1 hypothetical protein HanPSC8_Chr03g0132101 [Helianthus annuus]
MFGMVRYRYLKAKFGKLPVSYRTGTGTENTKNGYHFGTGNSAPVRGTKCSSLKINMMK